jgi:tRNA dimethylallyltransferase
MSGIAETGARVAVITGPTATGKTALAVALSRVIDIEVVSADSMQVYKYMDIGTAKPDDTERAAVPHHMIDVVTPFESYSVARYVSGAAAVTDDIIARGKLPVIVGGTGLYIDSLISGRDFADTAPDDLRASLTERYDDIGGDAMIRELKAFDPASAAAIDPANKRRVVRAFEIYRSTGVTMSAHDEQTRRKPPRYDAARFALDYADRARLYRRIDDRVDDMMARGLPAEVERLRGMGVPSDATAMQAIGYRELLSALRGDMTRARAVELMKQRSRNYAKRQLTWLRQKTGVVWIEWENTPDSDLGLQIMTKFLRP